MRRAATMDFNLSAAQRRLQGEARALAQSELAGRAAALDRREEYPWENVRLLKEAGCFGMTLPTRCGGRRRSCFCSRPLTEPTPQGCAITDANRATAPNGVAAAV